MNKLVIEIKWAVIFFIMALAWMYLEKITGLHSEYISKHAVLTNLFAIPAVAVYLLALLDKRKNYYGGAMTFLQGFISGLIITLIFTIMNPVSQILIAKIISPDFFKNAIEYAVNSGKMTHETAMGYFNLKSYIIQGFIGAPVMGTATSALVAVFIRSGKKSSTK